MRAEDIHPADMKRLLNAVFKQAVKDYVKPYVRSRCKEEADEHEPGRGYWIHEGA